MSHYVSSTIQIKSAAALVAALRPDPRRPRAGAGARRGGGGGVR